MKKLILLSVLAFLSLITTDGQSRSDKLKPQWLRQVPTASNHNVKFATTYTYVSKGNVSYADEMGRLTLQLPTDWHISSTITTTQISERNIDLRKSTGGMTQTGSIETEAKGIPVSINCLRVTEFRKDNSVWALYQVALGKDTIFENCEVTDRYGAIGGILSIIPGCGQFYKGDPAKGIIFLGGCAIGAGAGAFCLMQRQAYISQLSQTHDIGTIKQLDAKQKNFGIAGGICLGATAIMYIWNIIDGAIAPGAQRIVLTGNGINLNF